MDPNVSLQLSKRADETIWGKAISNIGRVVYSSNFSIYVLLVAAKRSSVLRAYKNYTNVNSFKDAAKRDAIIEKYHKVYNSYIDTLQKCIVENIYTKMQNNAATLEEQHVMSAYYGICKYKDEDKALFRNKLEILVLNMDWNTIQSSKTDLYISKYKEFYLYNLEELYKSQMRHLAILLANAKEGDRDQYEAVYSLIETYIKEVLPIVPESDENNQIIKDYRKYVAAIDSYERKDFLELRKRLTLLGFSKPLFEYALPLLAKEQCYREILEVARVILTNYYIDAEKFAAYEVILDAIEEYADNVLDYKIYWENEEEKKEYIKFSEKFSVLKKLARIDYDCYKRKREVLFINYDIAFMKRYNIKLPEVRAYYKERLIIRHAIKSIKNTPNMIVGTFKARKKNSNMPTEETTELIKNFHVAKEESSAISGLINNISELIHEQIDQFNTNAESAQVNAEENLDFSKPIFKLVNSFKNGKKLRKSKAM